MAGGAVQTALSSSCLNDHVSQICCRFFYCGIVAVWFTFVAAVVT